MVKCDIDGMADDYLRSLDGYSAVPNSTAYEFARMRLVALLEDAWDEGALQQRVKLLMALYSRE